MLCTDQIVMAVKSCSYRALTNFDLSVRVNSTSMNNAVICVIKQFHAAIVS